MADLAFPSAPGGDVAIDLIGDKTLLMPYIFDARREMAQFKAYYGIDEKRAAGEWTGFHRAEKRYPDGVTIEMISNGTQDILRLYGTVPPKGEEVTEEQPEKRPRPYLWVGARVMYEMVSDPVHGVPWNGFILMVIEPGENGVVTTSQVAWGASYSDHTYIRPSPNVLNANKQQIDLDYQDGIWKQYIPWVPPERRQYLAFDWQVDAARTMGNSGAIRFTKHMLRHYDISDTNTPTDAEIENSIVSWIGTPLDPLATDADLQNRLFPEGYGYPKTVWDQVVVLDPYEGLDEPTSHRSGDADTLNILEKLVGIAGDAEIISGEYIIKLAAWGDECKWSNVPYPYNYGWNEDIVNYWEPIPIEIEVRVGKFPDTVTERYQVTLSQYSQRVDKTWPFGNLTGYGACKDYESGTNPHGKNWWQGAILADPWALSIRRVEMLAPQDVFDTSREDWYQCQPGARIGWDIYCQVFQPQCAYAQGNYPNEVGHQVYYLIDQARRGVFGWVSIPMRTEQSIKNAAARVIDPNTGEGLYRYDPDTNIFVPVATPPEDPAYNYDPNSFRTWEYLYRFQSLLACRGFAKVRLGFGDPMYDGYVHSGDPANVANKVCCTYTTDP